MKEIYRTALLVILLLVAIGFIVWTRQQTQEALSVNTVTMRLDESAED